MKLKTKVRIKILRKHYRDYKTETVLIYFFQRIMQCLYKFKL